MGEFYTIDWNIVAKAVNKKLDKAYSGTYCRSVYERKNTSDKLLWEIKKVLNK
jgi:hypothetical protein